MKSFIRNYSYFLIALFFIVLSYPITTKAAEKQIFGDWEYQSISGGYVEITKYLGNSSDVIIPETIENKRVCTISSEAFRDNASIQSVVVSTYVTKVESSAFENCCNLSNITLPDKLTYIGYHAFMGTTISKLTIPKNVTYANSIMGGSDYFTSVSFANGSKIIPDSIFIGCESLSSVTIPNSVTKIESSSFENCCNLSNITLPDKLTYIGYHAFMGTTISKLTIPKNVTYANSIMGGSDYFTSVSFANGSKIIPDSIFVGCESLSSVTIPNSVTKIESSSFENCCNLSNMTLPDKLTYIGYHAFMGTTISKLTIPKNVTYANSIMGGSDYFTSVSFANGSKIIPDSIFVGCESLSSVTIPNSVTKIESSAFQGCNSLYDIVIPSSIINIGYHAFVASDTLTLLVAKNSAAEKFAKQNSIPYKISTKANAVTIPKTSITKLSPDAKKFSIKWKKVTSATGYTVQYATNKNFSSAKSVNITKNTIVSKTISGLKSNTTYYVRVRSYMKKNGSTYYSGWSATRSLKTK